MDMHHPTLWYPMCPICGHKATPRAGLGDERGPDRVPDDRVKCASCGHDLPIDAKTAWLPEELEIS